MERATSFGSVADDYDRLRPPLPAEAIRWLAPQAVAVAVDLGAGTGAMTRALAPHADRVVAVEPDPRMRAVLERRTPTATAVEGRGEAIPLPDASADLVVVASAWHWMNNAQTVAEVARVLRDGGRFAVVRIGRGEGSRWQVELAAEVGLDADVQQVEDEQAWSLRLDDDAPFEPVERAEFPFVHTMTVDDVANSLGTFSSVIALGQEGAADIVRRAREALVGRFGSDVDVAVELRATVDRCTRLAR